ncbi:hypothetical protein [Pedobacter cryoconitis]|uniref:Uncharacterized protein n=1 Tax=Pedobacter cryoconitis TaxID=188932 RepID=A0A7X0MHK5_9SPHI|nr:hypothetical protein [Pedobacter cryoconitis]MBB6498946.1 hypothetical protein [Pedobacter cryoconitis]
MRTPVIILGLISKEFPEDLATELVVFPAIVVEVFNLPAAS